ncbi:MAG: dienelactone hydrolase family protein [Verrucomicrobiae bacterium]|nr:dienelactone hydrolase family protein [Verrucomicrobiae bacterium]
MSPEDLRSRLLVCLGGPWPAPAPLHPVIRETNQHEGFRIESLTYESPSGLDDGVVERIPALLLVPDGVDAEHPAPAVAVWHQHNGEWHLGKSEPAGLAGNPSHHTGAALAREGYVVLCPDAQCFEERQDATERHKGGNYERFEFLRYLVQGKCMAWKNILDMRRAIDFLASRPEVKADRIGCYGHSMGSTHTWLVGPFEPRLKALVGNCCLPTYAAIHEHGLLHCFPNYVPGWLAYGDTPEIAALSAPRALHLNLGENDGGSPIAEARAGVERIADAYAAAGVPDRFSSFIEPGAGHVLSPAMWEYTRAWFARHLGE